MNSAGVLAQLGFTEMEVARTGDGGAEDMRRKFQMAENATKAVVEVLSMMAQYFRDIT